MSLGLTLDAMRTVDSAAEDVSTSSREERDRKKEQVLNMLICITSTATVLVFSNFAMSIWMLLYGQGEKLKQVRVLLLFSVFFVAPWLPCVGKCGTDNESPPVLACFSCLTFASMICDACVLLGGAFPALFTLAALKVWHQCSADSSSPWWMQSLCENDIKDHVSEKVMTVLVLMPIFLLVGIAFRCAGGIYAMQLRSLIRDGRRDKEEYDASELDALECQSHDESVSIASTEESEGSGSGCTIL